MLFPSQKNAVPRKLSIISSVLGHQPPEIHSPPLERLQRFLEHVEQPDHRFQRVTFQRLPFLEFDMAALGTQLNQLGHHLFVCLHITRFLATLDHTVQRRLRDIDTPPLDQGLHVSIQEGQQQGSNVAAVHVGVGHQDDLAVAPLGNIVELGTRRNPDRLEDVRDFLVLQNLGLAGFLHVEDLAAKRQDGLDIRITPGVGRSAGRVTFDQVQLRFLERPATTVSQLFGQSAGGQGPLATNHLAGLAGGFPGLRGPHALSGNQLRHFRIGFEKLRQPIVYDRGDNPLDLAVSQLGFGLPLELGIRNPDRDHRRQPLAKIITGRSRVLEEILLATVLVDRTRQRTPKTAQVRSPFDVVDVVGKRANRLGEIHVVLDGHIDLDIILLSLDRNHVAKQDLFGSVQVFDKLDQPLLIAEFLGPLGSFIRDQDPDSGIEKRHLLQSSRQRVEAEPGLRKDLRVGVKLDVGAGFRGFAKLLQWSRHLATLEVHRPELFVASNFHLEPFRKCVDRCQANTVQPTCSGLVTTLAIEFPPRVNLGEHHFKRRTILVFFQGPNRNSAAVILDTDTAIIVQNDGDGGRMTIDRFVDTVVDHLEDQVMQPARGGVADIHRRTHPDAFNTLQRSNLIRCVFGATRACVVHRVAHCVNSPQLMATAGRFSQASLQPKFQPVDLQAGCLFECLKQTRFVKRIEFVHQRRTGHLYFQRSVLHRHNPCFGRDSFTGNFLPGPAELLGCTASGQALQGNQFREGVAQSLRSTGCPH